MFRELGVRSLLICLPDRGHTILRPCKRNGQNKDTKKGIRIQIYEWKQYYRKTCDKICQIVSSTEYRIGVSFRVRYTEIISGVSNTDRTAAPL